MRLGAYSVGAVFQVGLMAVVFILLLKFVGARWEIPVVSQAARAV
jgi:hypothetical protein